MAESKILVVDNEAGMLEVCEDTLHRIPGIIVKTEQNSSKAEELLQQESWDLLITDIRMPKPDGLDILRSAKKHHPEILALMLTAFPSVDTAVESMKEGATDYLTKPFHPDDLKNRVQRLIQEKELREENRLLRRRVKQDHRMGEMIGRSQPMQEIFDKIQRIAAAEVDVLILGETGTGKELVARNIHQHSARNKENFVPVDCGSIPEDLLESELFGHERGAYTGATDKSMGLMEFAHKGTFFLDEIGQLSKKLQAKLLRVLQERKIRRVGGTSEIDIDVRIIAATSLDLKKEVENDRFRLDLFHRINVANIQLPPLKARFGDIPILTHYFLKQQVNQMGREPVQISDDALEILQCYSWPGNVRELQNLIKRILVMSYEPLILPDHLPEHVVSAAGNCSDDRSAGFFKERDTHQAQFEKKYFSNLLQSNNGDVSKAAEEANLPRGTLYRLLKKNDINPSDFRE